MSVKKLTTIALISCIAYLTILVFKVPVQFLSYEIKDVIIAIGAMYLGGVSGIIICFVVSIIEMITISDSGIIGFLMNFISSVSYIIPICYFYNKTETVFCNKIPKIVKGIILGTIFMSINMFIFNVILTPIYLGISLKETMKLLFTLVTPFNIIKGIINGFLIYLIYKPLLKIVKK